MIPGAEPEHCSIVSLHHVSYDRGREHRAFRSQNDVALINSDSSLDRNAES